MASLLVVPRGSPGSAKQWLIGELAQRGLQANASKIERLYQAGLAPRPRRPKKGVAPAELWPPGAVDHHAAAVPLLRQRHDCVEAAALTLVGWGYPVDRAPLERAYAQALIPDDPDADADHAVERRRKHPVPFLGQFARHLRSTAHPAVEMDELAYMAATASTSFLSGQPHSREHLAQLLTARFGHPISVLAPQVADFAFAFMARLASQFDGPALLETVRRHSVEDLLAAQPQAAKLVDEDLASLGNPVDDCPRCAEFRATLIALHMPALIVADELDWDALTADMR
jgi:hypothetical protein